MLPTNSGATKGQLPENRHCCATRMWLEIIQKRLLNLLFSHFRIFASSHAVAGWFRQ